MINKKRMWIKISIALIISCISLQQGIIIYGRCTGLLDPPSIIVESYLRLCQIILAGFIVNWIVNDTYGKGDK